MSFATCNGLCTHSSRLDTGNKSSQINDTAPSSAFQALFHCLLRLTICFGQESTALAGKVHDVFNFLVPAGATLLAHGLPHSATLRRRRRRCNVSGSSTDTPAREHAAVGCAMHAPPFHGLGIQSRCAYRLFRRAPATG
jgi:hypothetical protein